MKKRDTLNTNKSINIPKDMGINAMTELQNTGSKHKSITADGDRQNHTLNNSQKYWIANWQGQRRTKHNQPTSSIMLVYTVRVKYIFKHPEIFTNRKQNMYQVIKQKTTIKKLDTVKSLNYNGNKLKKKKFP